MTSREREPPVKRITATFAITFALVLSSGLSAQQFQPRAQQASETSRTSNPQVSQDLLAIYAKTKSAASESDITAIARSCADVIPDSQRSQVDRKYAASLLAWALNRRGEMRGERAASLVEQGDLESANTLDQQAAKDFETALEYGPSNFRIHHNLAISLAMKGDYRRAISEFTAAIELKPDYANSYFNRGELYFETQKFPQAEDDYSRALDLNASDPQYYNSRGHCRFMLEAYEDALSDYRRAAELGPDSAVYQTDLADAYQFLGQWEKAANAYRAAVAANSRYPRAYQNASWLMATCPDPNFRNIDLALSAAKKSLELGGKRTAQALDTLAAATAAVGKHSEAVKLQRQAMQLAEQDERAELEQRLKLYEQGRDYVQPQPTTVVSGRRNRDNPIQTVSGRR